MNFVSVYEDNFKSFYDQYFSQYETDTNNTLIITDPLPIYLDSFIYWMLTTDDIRNAKIGEQHPIIISIDFTTLDIQLYFRGDVKYHYMTAELDISSEYTISQQIDKIRSLKLIEPNTNIQWFLLNFQRILKYEDYVTIQYEIDIYDIFNEDIEIIDNYLLHEYRLFTPTIIYKTEDKLLQRRDGHIYLKYNEDNDDFKEIYLSLFRKYKYRLSVRKYFVVILSNFEPIMSRLKNYIDINCSIIIFPISYYYETIGKDIDIMLAFCGASKTLKGFIEWAKDKWNITASNNEDLCKKITDKIIDSYNFDF